jgi:hypothetical protein
MKKIFLALVLALVATTALAQPPVLGHNGSGQINLFGPGPPIQAIAHVYDRTCGAVPYPVIGWPEGPPARHNIILEGPAPVVWAGSCVIAEYIWAHNSYLRFGQLGEFSDLSNANLP